jgi:RNA polymerase sigma-70 factor (ECF subfamily)
VELIHAFRAGKEQAFVQLMARHERRVYNLAYRMLGRTEDARDATQEAFLSCFRHLSSFRGDAAFSTWLHRIAVNACYDVLRRRPPVAASVDDQPETAKTDDHADRVAQAADVQRALLVVPVEFRVALIMHEVQDMPVEDIAAVLEIPLGTVKSRLHRGRVALARALGLTPAVSPALEPRPAGAPSNPPTP